MRFLGWKSGDELQRYLSAADVYVQPGSQSATMQTSMCWRCAIVAYPHRSYETYLDNNTFFVRDISELREVFEKLANNKDLSVKMGERSYEIAQNILDYKVLAKRLYQ